MESKDQDKPKIGAGHAKAMARLGWAELGAAFVPSDSNIVQPGEYGIFGRALPSEVAKDRQADLQPPAGQSPSLEDRIQQMGPSRDDPERDTRDLEKE